MRPPQSGLVQVGIWEIISEVSPLPTDRQSVGLSDGALESACAWRCLRSTFLIRGQVKKLDLSEATVAAAYCAVNRGYKVGSCYNSLYAGATDTLQHGQ
jgi:hypothetical protein